LLSGSAITGKGLVLTQLDYQFLRHRIDVLARGLRERLASRTLVLLNCDLSDPNLKGLYLEATSHLSPRVRPIYVCGETGADQWPGIPSSVHVLGQSPRDLLAALAEAAPRPSPAQRELSSATVLPR